ncbi:unnamed protein product [Musa hybrid cultivar]
MRILSWVQTKFSGRQEHKRCAAALSSASCASIPVISKEEFGDWPQALLAIGTLGNRDIKEDPQRHESSENLQASEDLPDFTMEEVNRFQVELVKLLTRKPNSSTSAPEIAEADRANLLLNWFLNRPSSLEVDRKLENLGDLSPSTKIILSKVRDALLSNRTAIKKESLSFLFKKLFVCGGGFAPPRNLKDPIPEPRIDKVLRAILTKKIYPRSSALAPAKKYLANKPTVKMQEEDKRKDQYKWVKTDSECLKVWGAMSWAGPEDILFSTSLASYLDKKLLVLLRDGRKLLGILCSFDQFANVVLQGACERVIVGDLYCDIPLGLYVIRGENVVLIGEMDSEREELPAHMICVSESEIRRAQRAERDATDLKGSMRKRMEFLDLD